MKRLALLILGVACLVFVLAASPASATTETLTITSTTTLTEDHYGSVVIAADNITLDCAGHSVIGPGATTISLDGYRTRYAPNATL